MFSQIGINDEDQKSSVEKLGYENFVSDWRFLLTSSVFTYPND